MTYKKNFFFKLDYKKELEKHKTNDYHTSYEDKYNGNIIWDLYKSTAIQIQIFYDSSNYLLDKINFLQENNIDILKGISIYTPQYKLPETTIDLSKSELIKIKDDEGYWENGYRYVILEIDKIKFIEKYTSGEDFLAIATLHENALYPLHSEYEYHVFQYDKPNTFLASNKNQFVDFGDIRFILEFKITPIELSNQSLTIKFIPKIKITKQNYNNTPLSHEDIIKHIDIICTLLSFYYNIEIDFFECIINIPNSILTYVKQIDLPVPNKHLNNVSYSDFFENCDYKNVLKSYDLVKNITSRLIFSSRLDPVSEFMILYNIIEIIRNHYIDKKIIKGKSVNEYYSFKIPKRNLNKKIKEKLLEISDFVDDKQKTDYTKSINNKISNLKRMNMTNQFNSLFTALNIDVARSYKLNFNDIASRRNSIYHGSISSKNIEEFTDINKNLRNLIKYLIKEIIQYKNLS